MDKAGAAVRLPGKNDLPFPHLPTMTPDSVHLLTRSSQMTLFRDEQGRVRRAKLYYLRNRVGKAAKVKEKV